MITQDELNKLFTYEPSTGNLIRKVKARNGSKAGDIAGGKDAYGYITIRVNGKRYKAHRLIWVMIHGSIDSKLPIDHINQIKDDNRISNLRLVTVAINNKNIKRRSDNISGVVGVYWCNTHLRWVARINVNNKSKFLGTFTNKKEAIAAREAANIKYGFHINHGRDV